MWIYGQKTVEELPEDVVGFVYQITNLENGRMYICLLYTSDAADE